MGLFDGLRNWITQPLLDALQDQRVTGIKKARAYYTGEQKRQIVSKGSYDDNTVTNFCGLVIDRSISDMVGGGIEWEGYDDPALEYLKRVWDANKQEILLHRACLSAAQAGTGYTKIIPDGVADVSGLLPRLMVIDPEWMTIQTAPEDSEYIRSYTMRYAYVDDTGKERVRKEVTRREGSNWMVEYWLDHPGTSKFDLEAEMIWPYPFPPVIHWQNLPTMTVYGEPDITQDVIELQDKYNFISSNVGKIIRIHAHPYTVFKGLAKNNLDIRADNAIFLPMETQDVKNLEMQSDLASSMAYLREIRQALFDISRTVDLDSIQDKVGALTNFGLRVLYKDALAKINTKRELFGDALVELNRRLLVMAGIADTSGTVIFRDMLPENVVEEVAALQQDLAAGLVSKETAAQRRGYDWEKESEKLAGEQSQADNVGALLLRQFSRGQ